MVKDYLVVSEEFYSIQGENPTVGIPSIFLRVTGCNLTCQGWSYIGKSGEKLGCDSADVWKKGTKQSIKEIYERWKSLGWVDRLISGSHLVVTGGETLLQQEGLLGFLQYLSREEGFVPFVEVETNCTVVPSAQLDLYTRVYNVSPKLSSNGDSYELRYRPTVIADFVKKKFAVFKFVICSEEDVKEVYDQYINPFFIPKERITFMPEGTTLEDIQEHSRWLIEICKRESIRFSPRLHISIYDQTVGV